MILYDNNKTFRNLQQQVGKNANDILEIKQSLGEALPDPIPGPEGAQGPQGERGLQGPKGNSIKTCGYPLPDLPSSIYLEGDMALCVAPGEHLGDVYKVVLNAWVLQCNIRGPQGVPADGGSEVIANPEEASQDSITKIKIDGVVYAIEIPQVPVNSVNGKTGIVVLNAGDINATNSQSIQANLERIDERIDDDEARLDDLEEDYVPKTDYPWRVYGTDGLGRQQVFVVDTDDAYGSIPLRNIDDDIEVPLTPSSSKAAASKSYVDTKVSQISVPTKTSDLTNDSGFITEEDIPEIPTKTSDLTNDSGFITEEDIPEIPTKTSDLINDSGFITSSDIPSIPTKTSDLTNDSGFITEDDIGDSVMTINTNQDVYSNKTFKKTGDSLYSYIDNAGLAIYSGESTNYTWFTNNAIYKRAGSTNVAFNLPSVHGQKTLAVTDDIKNNRITFVDDNGTTLGSFTLNQSSNKTITIPSGGGGVANELMYSHSLYLQKHNADGFIIFRFNHSGDTQLYESISDFLDDTAAGYISTNTGYAPSEQQLNKIKPIIWTNSTSTTKTGYTSDGDLVTIDSTWDVLAEDVFQIQNKEE